MIETLGPLCRLGEISGPRARIARIAPIGRRIVTGTNREAPGTRCSVPGAADEESVDMTQPTNPPPPRQTTKPPPCPCGSVEHEGVRIGERLSPSGSALNVVYVCPAESVGGLGGAL